MPLLGMRRTISFALALLSVAATAGAQIVVGTFTGSITYPPKIININGYVAYVDISGGRLTPYVTPPLRKGAPCFGKSTVALTDTVTFFRSNPALVLATNANLGPPMQSYSPGACGNADGLLKNGGSLVNPMQSGGPTVYFTTKTNAVAGVPTSQQGQQALWAVSGFIDPNGVGTLLVSNGKNSGSTAQPAPTLQAPRVAAGVTQDEKTLIIAMVNGNEGNGVGLQLPDFADLLRGLGAYDAVNLDGGGSSTFVYMPGANTIVPEPSLVALFNAAKPVSNANHLVWKLAPHPANENCVSYPQANVTGSALCLKQPMAPTLYRSIYANWGFSVIPAPK